MSYGDQMISKKCLFYTAISAQLSWQAKHSLKVFFPLFISEHVRDEILKAYTRVKSGLCVCLDPSKAQVKTRVLDGLEFRKNQPSWVLLFSS